MSLFCFVLFAQDDLTGLARASQVDFRSAVNFVTASLRLVKYGSFSAPLSILVALYVQWPALYLSGWRHRILDAPHCRAQSAFGTRAGLARYLAC